MNTKMHLHLKRKRRTIVSFIANIDEMTSVPSTLTVYIYCYDRKVTVARQSAQIFAREALKNVDSVYAVKSKRTKRSR